MFIYCHVSYKIITKHIWNKNKWSVPLAWGKHSRSAGSWLHPVVWHTAVITSDGRKPSLHLNVILPPSSVVTLSTLPFIGGSGRSHPGIEREGMSDQGECLTTTLTDYIKPKCHGLYWWRLYIIARNHAYSFDRDWHIIHTMRNIESYRITLPCTIVSRHIYFSNIIHPCGIGEIFRCIHNGVNFFSTTEGDSVVVYSNSLEKSCKKLEQVIVTAFKDGRSCLWQRGSRAWLLYVGKYSSVWHKHICIL